MAVQQSRLGRGLGSLISGGVENGSGGKTSTNGTGGNGRNGNGRASAKPGSGLGTNGRNGKNAVAENIGNPEFQEIPVKGVVSSPYQAREQFDGAGIDDLVASIRSGGLLQPIVVREVDGHYELIAGERRLRAMKKLKKNRIAARVLEVDDLSSAALSLVENLQRTDLNPVEESHGYETLMNEFGLTQEKAAKQVGKSRAYVANALRLLQLDIKIQKMLASGELSVGHAKVLLGLSGEGDRLQLAKRILDEGLSVRDAETQVRILKGEDPPGSARVAGSVESSVAILKPAAVVRYEKALGGKLAAGVVLKHSAGDRGRIMIDYRSLEDLKRIMGALGV